MNRLMNVAMGAAMLVAVGASAGAQTKTVMGDVVTITAVVETIDVANRTVTVKGSKGEMETIAVPRSMEKFSELKVGDTISARYYENIVFRKKPAGEAAVDTAQAAVTPSGAAKGGGTGANQRTITAVITAIDNSIPSITFKGETVKFDFSTRVVDKKALAQVKAGDRVDITWTEAAMITIVAPKK